MAARDPDLKAWSKRDLEREVTKLRHVLKTTIGASENFWYESGVSSTDGKPFVQFTWGVEAAQLSPAEVRDMAIKLVETAGAAEFDAALMRVLRDRFEWPEQQSAVVMVMLREERAKLGLHAPGIESVGDPVSRENLRRDVEGDDPA